MNKYMTRGEFEDFIFKHAPLRAKNYNQAKFARWFLVFGQNISVASKVWRAWNNMSLSQCAYLNSFGDEKWEQKNT